MTNPPPPRPLPAPHRPPSLPPTGHHASRTPPRLPPGHPVRNPYWSPPPPSKQPIWLWFVLGGVLILSLLGGLAIAVGREADKPDSLPLTAEQADRTARLDHLAVTIAKVETGASRTGDDSSDESADGEFVIITLDIENVGTFSQTFYDDDHYLVDNKDRRFDWDKDATHDFNRGGRIELQPGFKARRIIVFDVPEGTNPVAMSFSPGFMTPHIIVAFTRP